MKVALRDYRGQYVTTWDVFQGQHPLVANRGAIGEGETFELVILDGTSPVPAPPPTPPEPSYWLQRPYIQSQLIAVIYGPYHAIPGPRGSGPLDIDYFTDVIIETGGWVNPTIRGENNIGYWTDKIQKDLEIHGYRRT
jgi:hypothetical protein